MIITTKNRRIIYTTLFNEGALYAEKNHLLPEHPMFKGKGIRNVEVCKLMLSLKSREYVEEAFSWQHYYWTLTDKGIEYIRAYLNIPENKLPATQEQRKNPGEGSAQISQRGPMRGSGGRGGYSFSRGRGGGLGSRVPPAGDE